ncbi:BrnA antitoxin family protein [Methylobacterium sp. J-090]|uniref:BrnA antitoxin family protein n=1 Tax=Methylobacterium sp. J-090 TaxID=2836666 RepID=UPI001FBBBE98|nr:BrnA antitoxin family protein [Methylobacterium sp. J-090]MCJ2083392.1 BrnA antitoxin family protein [Methylobacterium sp. J-090]
MRFDSLDAMPPATPLSAAFKALSDEDAARRAAADPDAGVIPPGFWDALPSVAAETKEQITLRLDPEVLRHFRGLGKGYQSRINAVLKSYVRAKENAG